MRLRLPKERIIFAVDFIATQQVLFRNLPDSFLPNWENSLQRVLALDGERMIPGHAGPGGRLGTKDDLKNLLAYMADLSAEVKNAADAGKCWDGPMKDLKLPKCESWEIGRASCRERV